MKKADFILIGAVLAVVCALLLILYLPKNNVGAYVKIEIDGRQVQTLPLDENTSYDISTALGKNTLVIEDGYAFMSEADCPDGICVKHRKINKNGESIICLPHKVVVSVVSAENSEVDL